jgi:AraC-like DNA-binding protein
VRLPLIGSNISFCPAAARDAARQAGIPLAAISARAGVFEPISPMAKLASSVKDKETKEATRHELAQYYLINPRVTLSEIAYLLRYADQSTFFRASHR